MDLFGSWQSVIALVALGGIVAATRLVGWSALRWGLVEAGISLSLARSIDGRHALRLAWGLRRAAHKLRGTLKWMHDDPSHRATVLVTLGHFTGGELSALLRRMHVLIATGDNDRVRALNAQFEEHSRRWAELGEGPERRQLDAAMAQIRQQMEESRRTSRAWVGLIRKLEETGSALKSLERDLALYGVSNHSALPDFRQRLDDIAGHIQNVQQARRELEAERSR